MRSLTCLVGRAEIAAPAYQLTDRLHAGRSVRGPADGIVSAASTWLAELGVSTQLVDDLARTVRSGDWSAAHAIAEWLSVDVSVAA